MQLAMIGLGKMGGNMTERLMRDGHQVVVFDRSPEVVQKYAALGAIGAGSPSEVARKMTAPASCLDNGAGGKPVDDTIAALLPGCSRATSSSTVETRTSAIRCGAQPSSSRRESTSSIQGRAAESGVWRTGTV
jgi:3-hydroxyisobutyrate dehydrogenase-like beta-hydroxyacid dehydrogenase